MYIKVYINDLQFKEKIFSIYLIANRVNKEQIDGKTPHNKLVYIPRV
jgi:hypothetical protein